MNKNEKILQEKIETTFKKCNHNKKIEICNAISKQIIKTQIFIWNILERKDFPLYSKITTDMTGNDYALDAFIKTILPRIKKIVQELNNENPVDIEIYRGQFVSYTREGRKIYGKVKKAYKRTISEKLENEFSLADLFQIEMKYNPYDRYYLRTPEKIAFAFSQNYMKPKHKLLILPIIDEHSNIISTEQHTCEIKDATIVYADELLATFANFLTKA